MIKRMLKRTLALILSVSLVAVNVGMVRAEDAPILNESTESLDMLLKGDVLFDVNSIFELDTDEGELELFEINTEDMPAITEPKDEADTEDEPVAAAADIDIGLHMMAFASPMSFEIASESTYHYDYEDGTLTIKASEFSWSKLNDIPWRNSSTFGIEEVTSVIINRVDSSSSQSSVDIPPHAFEDFINLENVVFDQGLNTGNGYKIGAYAFKGCANLKTFDFSHSSGGTITLGDYAFADCNSLTTLNLPSSALIASNDLDVAVSDPQGVFKGCTNLETLNIVINTEVSKPIKIFDSMFENCTSLQTITYSVYGLTSPDSLNAIGNFAFKGCSALKIIDFGLALEKIGDGAFENCKRITDIEFLEAHTSSLDEIGGAAFAGTVLSGTIDLTALTALTTIGPEAFSCTAIESFIFGAAVDTIGQNIFGGCAKLASISLPPTDFDIIRSGYYHDNPNTDDENAVSEWGDANYDMYDFAGDQSSLGSTVLGGNDFHLLGFHNLPNLAEVLAPGSTFFSSDNIALYYDSGSNIYFTFYPPKATPTNYNIKINTVSIESFAFANTAYLERVNIPASVDPIKSHAFYNNSKLRMIQIAENSGLNHNDAVESNAFVSQHALGVYFPNKFTPRGPGEPLWIFDHNDEESPFPEKDYRESFGFFEAAKTGTNLRLYIYTGNLDNPNNVPANTKGWFEKYKVPYHSIPDQELLNSNPPPLMYKYIPYKFTAKASYGINGSLDDMVFALDEELPEGLYFKSGDIASDTDTRGRLVADHPNSPDEMRALYDALPNGTIYGVPLDYTAFEDGVNFNIFVRNATDLEGIYSAKAQFTIKLAPPTRDAIINRVNTLSIIPDPPTATGTNSNPSGWFDMDMNKADHARIQRIHTEGEFGRFYAFYIDGRLMKEGTSDDYTKDEGSTIVTLTQQTITNLSTDEEHVAALAFTRTGDNGKTGEVDVIAQTFTVRDVPEDTSYSDEGFAPPLPDPVPPAPPSSSGSGGGSSDNDYYDYSVRSTPQQPTQQGTPPPVQPNPAPMPAPPLPFIPVAVPPAPLPTPTPPPTEPQENSGYVENPQLLDVELDENGNVIARRGEDFRVRIGIDYDQFTGDINIDSTVVPRDDFNSSEGSTIIEVEKSYMNALSDGAHTLSVIFKEQEVEIPFVLQDTAPTQQPQTIAQPSPEKTVSTPLIITLSVIAAAAVLGGGLYLLRRGKRLKPGSK